MSNQVIPRRHPLQRATLSMQIAEQLRDDIIRGVFEVGSKLNEVQLAEGFGVSRGPLREAMQRLIQEGLLHSEPNRRVFVPDLSLDDLLDVYFVRSGIEAAALQQVLATADRKSIGRVLTDIARRMHSAVTSENWSDGSELDFLFHRTLVDAAASMRLSRMYLTIQAETRLCLHRFMGGYRNSKALAKEHLRLARLVEKGPERDALAAHLVHPTDACDKARSNHPTDAAVQ